jgi:4-alpha-glucanotransferase
MTERRHAGVNLPLFSARSTGSWGIGEIGDLAPLAEWLGRAAFDRLMLLPLGTIPDGQTSPYSATSTLSIDPIYISISACQDFERAGGVARLSAEALAALEASRQAPAVSHDTVRLAKGEALRVAFEAFRRDEWEQLTPRAAGLAAYVARERWWLDDYALFQALSDASPGVSWRHWPAPLRDRDSAALEEARRQLAADMLRHQYWQWLAESQWQDARSRARQYGVELVGDLPFVASMHSPEVWARADEFLLDVSAGVPPDAFSPTGQDWGLPTYRWDFIARSDYAWIRQRARRMAALFDGIRVDHVIGLYRTYGRPPGGEPFFTPAGEAAQRAQGQAVLRILQESGTSIIAEDLGLVPDFLRESLAELGIPGCKVIRWERDWDAPGHPFVDPRTYPADSAAMSGTHDTEPLCVWWTEECTIADRTALLALPVMQTRGIATAAPWSGAVRDALLDLAYQSGSRHLFLPIQDLFGWPSRINTPGTVGHRNWTWCLPWPVDRLADVPEAAGRAAFLRDLAAAAGRTAAG